MLSIQNLVKVYPGPVTALAGIDLDLDNGMFGLLGPNGAGKSTLMRIVAGLLEPTAGSVTLDGEDVVADPSAVRRKLGYLPQEFGFYPHLSGEAMLRHLLELKGVHAPGGLAKLTGELLERVNLAHARKRKVKGWSGGMKQRLGIAQALAGDPRLIIADEPTAGLDPEERQRFYDLLAEMAEDRIVVLSTHIVEDVATLCSQFVVIHGGRIIARTTPQEARDAIEGTMFDGSAAASELAALRERYCVTQAPLVGGRRRVRIHSEERTPPPGFEPTRATLEDAYLVMMRTRVGGRARVGAAT